MRCLCIVVPVWGEPAAFEHTLASVLRHCPANAGVLVPHDGSYRDPHRIGGEVELVSCRRSRGLVGLLMAAVQRSNSPIIHLLRPGVEAVQGWTEEPLAAFARPSVGSACSPVAPPDGRAGDFTVALGWAGFWRRRLLQQTASDPGELLSLLWDQELAIRAAASGWDDPVVCPQRPVVAAGATWDTSPEAADQAVRLRRRYAAVVRRLGGDLGGEIGERVVNRFWPDARLDPGEQVKLDQSSWHGWRRGLAAWRGRRMDRQVARQWERRSDNQSMGPAAKQSPGRSNENTSPTPKRAGCQAA